jgi:predicted RNA-binding Zn ribbon-like protein
MAFDENHFIGGALCLDFANTVGGHRDGEPKESLHAYADLLDWAVAGGAISKASGVRLRDVARVSDARAARTLVAAKELREAIYEVFVALADKRQPPTSDLAKLNAAMADAYANLQLRAQAGAFDLTWPPATSDLRAPLWPIVKSAVDLLLDRKARLRACASDTCSWLFIDESKNHSRRWCSMRDCGNRAKVRRFRTTAA